jgi:hypothetical protein
MKKFVDPEVLLEECPRNHLLRRFLRRKLPLDIFLRGT